MARRLYAYRVTDDAVLYYPLYALLFADAGLSAAQITSLFVIWSLVTFVLEVPSGAWADAFSRRRLLTTAALLRAVGFALWTVWPTYWGFALGFVLWGIRGALESGCVQAVVYDELAAARAEDRYVRVTGRADALALIASLAATGLATPGYLVGGYALVGAASVAVSLANAVAAWSLPERRHRPHADLAGFGAYRAQLHSGLRAVRRRVVLRRAVLLASAVYALGAVDEYLGLLLRDSGATTAVVPLLLLLPAAAMAAAGWWAERWAAVRPVRLAVGLVVAAAALAAGALSGHPLGVVGSAIFLAYWQFAALVSEARLQETIEASARATVLSVSGVGSELGSLVLLGGVALGSLWWGIGALVAAFAVPVLALAAITPRWLPPPPTDAPAPADLAVVVVYESREPG